MSLKGILPFFINTSPTSQDKVGVNTTSDGFQVVVFFGDSNMAGRGEVPGPAPAPGTAYQWSGSAPVEITNTDILTAVYGSIGPKLCTEWFQRTGKKFCIVPCGSGGSNFAYDGDTNNWTATGVLRNPTKNKVNACLSYFGLTEMRFAFRKLGINDARPSGAADLSLVQAGINDLQAWFRAQFGNNVPLLTNNIGRDETGVSSRILTVRQMIEDEALNFPRTYVAVRDENYLSYYKSDNLHLNQTGLNLQAVEFVNYILANNL